MYLAVATALTKTANFTIPASAGMGGPAPARVCPWLPAGNGFGASPARACLETETSLVETSEHQDLTELALERILYEERQQCNLQKPRKRQNSKQVSHPVLTWKRKKQPAPHKLIRSVERTHM